MNVLELVFKWSNAIAANVLHLETIITRTLTLYYICTRYWCISGYPMRGIPYDLCRYKTLSKEEVISLYNTSLHLNDCGAEFVWEKPENQR